MKNRLACFSALLLAFSLATWAAPGELDGSFGESGVSRIPGRELAESLIVDPTGRIYLVVERNTATCGTTWCPYIARRNPDGTADLTFGSGGYVPARSPTPPIHYFSPLRLGTDGALLLQFEETASHTHAPTTLSLLKFQADGTPFPGFTAPSYSYYAAPTNASLANLLVPLPGGKFFFANAEYLARHMPDGSIDPTFNGGAPVSAATLGHWDALAPLPDGGAMLLEGAGNFNISLYRMNPDGSRAFGSTLIPGPVNGKIIPRLLVRQDDGRLVALFQVRRAGGSFDTLVMRRYLANGGVDGSFGFQGEVTLATAVPTRGAVEIDRAVAEQVLLQADGKILVTSTDLSAGFSRIFIARLEASGALDGTFGEAGVSYIDASAGQDSVGAMALRPEGIYLVGTVDASLIDTNEPTAVGAVMRVRHSATSGVVITPATLLAGGVGQPYSQGLSAQGGVGSYTFANVGGALPPGVALTGSTLQGTPTAGGRYRFHVRATDSLGAEETRFYALDVHTDTSLIVNYYGAVLGRAAESSGVAFWESEVDRVVALGADPNDVLHALSATFFGSAEYAARGRNDTEFVADLYRAFLGREPDASGSSYWASQLANGLPRGAILNEFMFTPEFESNMDRIFGPRASRAEVRMAVDFYRGLLGRLPDSDGLQYWVGRFRAAQCGGSVSAEVEAISSFFISLPEYGQRQAALPPGERTRGYVVDLYNAFLRRGGDAPGFQYWVSQLDSGSRDRDNVRRQFVASPEFQVWVAAVIQQGCMN